MRPAVSASPPAPRPEGDSDEHETASQAIWIRSAALWGILFLLVMYTLYFTAPVTMPIALAFLLNLVLAPVVECLEKLRIPRLVSAISILVSIMAVIAAALYALAGPASDWIDRAPSALRSLEYELAWVKEPIDDINDRHDHSH